QQPVLAPGEPLAQLLQRVQRPVVVDEADHVPGDAALADLHQPLVGPVRERLRPRQGQQAGRVVGGWGEDEAHRYSSTDGAMLAPVITTATCSAGAGLYTPAIRAAIPTEAAGAAAIRSACHRACCAARIEASSTSTTSST